MKSFDIGLSALRTHQHTLATLGSNVANASTPGYHRQRVELASRPPGRTDGFQIGSGVEITRITRMRNTAVETALLRNSTQTGFSQKSVDINKQIETLLTPSDSSIHTSLSSFFNRLESAANSPQDLTVRREFLSSAAELMNTFNRLDQALADLSTDVSSELEAGVEEINQLINNIGSINEKIFEARSGGSEPNDLLDQRDQMITELSEWIDVDQEISPQGQEFLVIGGGTAITGQRSMELRLIHKSDGSVLLAPKGTDVEMPVVAGKVRALLDAHNDVIPDTRDRLTGLARQIIQAVDAQHAKGIPDTGSFSVLLGQRGMESVTEPLIYSNPEFPVNGGDIYVTVTTKATGVRRTEKVSIDPTTDSLQDIAAKFDALSGVSSAVDSVRGTISFSAEQGYSFDFAGRPDNRPDLTSVTGTSLPEFTGAYSGTTNDQWTVSFSGAGTIGQTSGLTATVRDKAGHIIATHNVGSGYEAGKPLQISNGISLKLGSGTVGAADQFSVYAVAESDETGLLAAAGVNSLFSGSTPGVLGIREELFNSPQALSGTLTGAPGDATNFASLARLRDVRFDVLGSRTFVEELSDVTADTGLAVQAAENQNTQLKNSRSRLEADRDAVSGVDINEETLRMMEVQRAYQAAAKFITIIDGTLEELLQMTR